MKKIAIFALIILTSCLASCSLDDDDINFSFEQISIEEVDIPDEFTRGEIYEISTFYFRPSDCHSFSGFSLDRISNEIFLAVQNVVVNDRPCEDLEETQLIEESFDFFVGAEDSYIFAFWQGIDDQGENQFLIIEVPVVE